VEVGTGLTKGWGMDGWGPIEVATKRPEYRPYPPKSPPVVQEVHGAKRLLDNLVHNLSVIVFVKTHVHYQQQPPAGGSGGTFREKGYWNPFLQ
jgi:hypothetical protein